MLVAILLLVAQLSLTQGIDIKIGLMYSLTRIENTVRQPVVSRFVNLATTLALINQLNEGSSSLTDVPAYNCPDVTFSVTVIDTLSDFSKALLQLDSANTEFDVILMMGRSSTCVPVSFVTSTAKTPIISSSCTSPELDDGLTYKFFSRTIPSDESVGSSLIDLLAVLPAGERTPVHPLDEFDDTEPLKQYNSVTVLYQEDVYGSEFKDALFENAPNTIDLELIPFVPRDAASIEAALDSAKAVKLNVFICMIFLDDLSTLVEKAVEKGLMNEDRVWIFTDGVIGAGEIAESIKDPTILAALNNSFLVQADGKVEELDAQREVFVNDLYNPDAGYDKDQMISLLPGGDKAFSESNDVVNGTTLPRAFSEVVNEIFDQKNLDFQDFALYAYDAVLAIRQAYEDTTSEGCPSTPIDGERLIEFLTSDSFSLPGITGDVQFSKGSASRDVSSAAMKMLNLRFFKQDDDFVGESVQVGSYTNDEWEIDDDKILFASGNIQAPLKTDPPPNIRQIIITPAVQGIAFTCSGILMVVSVGLIVFVYIKAEVEVFAAAQPFFLLIMLIGVLLSCTAVFILYVEPVNLNLIVSGGNVTESLANDLRCNLSYALISLGLTLSYGSLTFKLQRLILINNRLLSSNQAKISMFASMKYLIGVVVVNIGMIVVIYTINPLTYEQVTETFDEFLQSEETYDVCIPKDNDKALIYLLYLAFYIVFYSYSLKLVYQVRNLPTDFQEGRWISVSILAQLQLFILGIAVVIAVGNKDPSVTYLVLSLLVVLSNLMLLILIFGPKFYKLLSGQRHVVYDRDEDRDVAYDFNKPKSKGVYRTKSDVDREVRVSLHDTVATDDLFEEADDKDVIKDFPEDERRSL